MGDLNKAFEIPEGIIVNPDSGGPFITGGTLSPVGFDLPIGTLFFQVVSNGALLWQKVGLGADDWVKTFLQPEIRPNKAVENSFLVLANDELCVFQDGCFEIKLRTGQKEFVFFNTLEVPIDTLLGVKLNTCVGVNNEFGQIEN